MPRNKPSPINIICIITPTLKTSHIVEYDDYLSTKLATSGATNPGVPHLGKI